MLHFLRWLENTTGSIALHESLYAFPVVESVHVWTLALFVGFAMLLDLRLMGLALRRIPVSHVARAVLPWTVASFLIMVGSGVATFYARPVHYYQSIFFRVKLALLVVAGLNAWLFHAGVWTRVAEWDADAVTPKRARVAAAASLLLWALIVFLGRAIAYNWFDCDSPQRPIIAWLEGCSGTM